jgi:hypothetical protein
MDEGKNPNATIYKVDEVDELKEELGGFLDQLALEGAADLISRLSVLKTDLERHEPTEAEMRDASICYHDAQWEFYQFLKKKSFDRKHEEAQQRKRAFAEKCLMSTLTNAAEDDLIVGMSGGRMPWNCGD